jgi:hypothetical protein
MDTPERGDYFFSEATEANRALVEGQQVILVKDVSKTDRYGRLLRYVYLEDGTFVNAELVRQGNAVIATFPPDVRHQGLFLELEREARDPGQGLWAQPLTLIRHHPTHSRQLLRLQQMCRPQPHQARWRLLMHRSRWNRPTAIRLIRPFVFPLPHRIWIVVKFRTGTLLFYRLTLIVLRVVMMVLAAKVDLSLKSGWVQVKQFETQDGHYYLRKANCFSFITSTFGVKYH